MPSMPVGAVPAERLFIAVWPQPAVRDAIAQWQGAWQWPRRCDRVRPERLHATLHFLGSVAADRLPALARSLRVPFQPFELELVRGEVWPNGVAVLLPEATPAALLQLHADLGVALTKLRLPVEARPYRAHVTLARRAHGAVPPGVGPGLRWRVTDGYVLVRSLPSGGGYEVLERFG